MDKRALREYLRNQPPPSSDTVARVTEGLFRFLSPRLPATIAGYLAMGDEIDVSSLFDRLPGWRWVLPRIESDGSLTLRDSDVESEKHPWGMRQPVASGPEVPPFQLDLVLAPGLAFDDTGARLGRGGGFYDRLLSSCREDCLAIGVTWAGRMIAAVPTDPHDRRLGWLATETGVKRCAPTR